MQQLRVYVPTLFLLTLLGCENKVSAPALTDDLVYENSAGMRFVVPERWSVTAKSNIPDAIPSHPTRLVAYHSPTSLDATLDVYVANIPAQTSLNDYLTANPISPRRWTPEGSPESLTINGKSATRTSYSAKSSKNKPLRREIVLFDRDGLCYFFLLEYGSDDTKTREQARRAIESTVWN